MRSYVLLAALAGLPIAAQAGIIPATVSIPVPDMGEIDPGNYGYAPRAGTPGVAPGDSASMSLVMIDAQDHAMGINTGGEVMVQRGGAFTSIGANRNGGGNILAAWDEVVQGNNVYINAIFKTVDGSMIVPPTATINGNAAFFWSWHFGAGAAAGSQVNYMNWVSQVDLVSARLYFSDNSGMSFNSFADISAGHNGSFLNGRDNGQYLATVGDGTNYMLAQYQIRVIPAPAGLAALGGAGLLATRRRRR